MPDEPIEYGNDCGACLAAGTTPKFVYARFSELVRCTGVGFDTCPIVPNGRVFKLEQTVANNCSYEFSDSVYTCLYSMRTLVTIKSRLFLYDSISRGIFRHDTDPCKPEGFVFTNQLSCTPGLTCGTGGIGVVTWSPQATDLLSSLNISKTNDLFMELFPRDDGDLVYKFCRLRDSMNIKILFEP